MRPTPLLLLLLLTCPPASAEVYRWVDENGVVHYTDKSPKPGAEPAELPNLQSYQPRQVPAPDTAAAADPDAATPDYQRRIANPRQDEVIRSPAPGQTVSATVKPALARGHGLQFLLDGQVANEQPTRSQSVSLPTVYRGTHTLVVRVVDADGKELKRSDTVTFHKLPPTVRRNAP